MAKLNKSGLANKAASSLTDLSAVVSEYQCAIRDLEKENAELKEQVRELQGRHGSRVAHFILEGEWAEPLRIIIVNVAAAFHTPIERILSRRKMEEITVPRHLAMWLARELTDASLSTIARAFHRHDHSTILHAARSMQDRLDTIPEFRARVERLRDELKLILAKSAVAAASKPHGNRKEAA